MKQSWSEQTMSQENVSDKVRNLQRQIAQSMKFGQKPPSLLKTEEDQDSSNENEVRRSPLKVFVQVEAEYKKKEQKGYGDSQAQGIQQVGIHNTPVKSSKSKCVLPAIGTIESINLDSVPQSVPRLDNTAAKHKLSIKPKNQRISRKHRRFTQDLLLMSQPPIMNEETEDKGDPEAALPNDEEHNFNSPELSNKQRRQMQNRLYARGKREGEELGQREVALDEERKKRTEEAKKQQQEDTWITEEEKIKREEKERRIKDTNRKIRREKDERKIFEQEQCRQRDKKEKRRVEEQSETEESEKRQCQLESVCLPLEEKRLKEVKEQVERKKYQIEGQRLQELEENSLQEAEDVKRKKNEEEERNVQSADECEGSLDPMERKRRAEEMRWKEMEQRQRPFSFKVSSGEKQILFQKVNLTPVTLASSQKGGTVTDLMESSRVPFLQGVDSLNLSSFQYVPHTAILVTGAQLCGPAVNLDQIKDTACKSLLGFGEATPPTNCKISPEIKSVKTGSLNKSFLCTDYSNVATLAEWASIRSKIFKGSDEGTYENCADHNQNQVQSWPSNEDLNQTFPHTNLRKTMSASTKFSITPAKKKFADANRHSEFLGQGDKDGGTTKSAQSDSPSDPSAVSLTSSSKAQGKSIQIVRIADMSEGCMFAKDLPSFLVPSPAHGFTKPEGPEAEAGSLRVSDDSDESEEGEKRSQGNQIKPSPFGIKLRRTNFSLRFQSEQPTEKRKKRYSAGDSFDGVPTPLTLMEPASNYASVFHDKSNPTSPLAALFTSEPWTKQIKMPPQSAVYHRPSTSLNAVSTVIPPQSPLLEIIQGGQSEAVAQKTVAAADSACKEQQVKTREESSSVAQLHGRRQGEEEPKENKSFFPSISIPWREKADRKTEFIRREKPSLQSRHSLDSVRVQEKEIGPLWITLALQKQKGFREQQQSRDERRSQREAKLVERQTRENSGSVSPTDNRGNTNTSPKHHQALEEPKRPDALLASFERRDHLTKSNTLPSSVTVEIADSTPLPPPAVEVSKRFPSNDSSQVSTEPAWLALAKRKAKAWSDCPQIIK